MFNLILKEDDGIQIIAGKAGSGKSKMCQILAHEFGYLHLDYDRGDFRNLILPTSCDDLEKIIVIKNNYKGLILDCPISILNEYLPDWDKHEWIIPIIVTKQLNRNAILDIGEKEEKNELSKM